jgi:hypothetical protein
MTECQSKVKGSTPCLKQALERIKLSKAAFQDVVCVERYSIIKTKTF